MAHSPLRLLLPNDHLSSNVDNLKQLKTGHEVRNEMATPDDKLEENVQAAKPANISPHTQLQAYYNQTLEQSSQIQELEARN